MHLNNIASLVFGDPNPSRFWITLNWLKKYKNNDKIIIAMNFLLIYETSFNKVVKST